MHTKVKMISSIPDVDPSLKLPYYCRGFEITANGESFLTPSRAGTVTEFNAKKTIPKLAAMNPKFSIIQASMNLQELKEFLTMDMSREKLVNRLKMHRRTMQNSAITMLYVQPTTSTRDLRDNEGELVIDEDGKRVKIRPATSILKEDPIKVEEYYYRLIELAHDTGVKTIGLPHLHYFDNDVYYGILRRTAERALSKKVDPLFVADPEPAHQNRFQSVVDSLVQLKNSELTNFIGVMYKNPARIRNAMRYLRKIGSEGMPYVVLNTPRTGDISLSGLHTEEIIGGDIVSVEQPHGKPRKKKGEVSSQGNVEVEEEYFSNPVAFFRDGLDVTKLSLLKTDEAVLRRFIGLLNESGDEILAEEVQSAIYSKLTPRTSSIFKLHEYMSSYNEFVTSQDYIIPNDLKDYVSNVKPLLKKWVEKINSP